MTSCKLAVKPLCTVLLSLEVMVALWNGTNTMLLMVDEQVSICVPSDHCEYIEIVSLDPTVGGMRILAIEIENSVEIELDVERLDTVMTCEVGEAV